VRVVRIARADAYRPDAFEPSRAVALLGTHGGGAISATGSAFRFGHDNVLLSARHCVSPTLELAVRFLDGSLVVVGRVIEHPVADVAVLLLAGAAAPSHVRQAFGEISRSGVGGDEFMSFGFPTEGPTFDDVAGTPTPRVFTGHYQRFFDYASPSGYRYRAGEMSIAAPSGLSGAPLFRRHNPSAVTGLVTTNVDAYAVVDSVTVIDDRGATYREEARRVISYGLALQIPDVRDWLRDSIPWREVGGIDPPRSLTLVR
jgi:hypothetical protein